MLGILSLFNQLMSYLGVGAQNCIPVMTMCLLQMTENKYSIREDISQVVFKKYGVSIMWQYLLPTNAICLTCKSYLFFNSSIFLIIQLTVNHYQTLFVILNQIARLFCCIIFTCHCFICSSSVFLHLSNELFQLVSRMLWHTAPGKLLPIQFIHRMISRLFS